MIDPTEIDTSDWVLPAATLLSAKKQKLYNRNLNAFRMVCDGRSFTSAAQVTGIRADEIRRLVFRACMQNSDGESFGYQALIPHQRFTAERVIGTESISRKGQFDRLLQRYPEVGRWFKSVSISPKSRSDTKLHEQFLSKLKDAGAGADEYPFSTKDSGRRTFSARLKNTRDQRKKHKASRASRAIVNLGWEYPYATVEADGWEHPIPATVVVRQPDGRNDYIRTPNLYLFCAIDVDKDIIIGAKLSLGGSYSALDVCDTIWRSVADESLVENSELPDDSDAIKCFPPELSPHLQWIAIDELKLDRAKAHKADAVVNLIRATNSILSFDEARSPKFRATVENLFSRFTRLWKDREHQLPKHNGKILVTFSDLEQLMHACIRQHNCHSKNTISKASPVGQLLEAIDRGEIIRRIPKHLRDESNFYKALIERTVRGHKSANKTPYIEYKRCEYRDPDGALAALYENRRVVMEIYLKDLRTIRVLSLEDGSFICTVRAQRKWSKLRHSVELRDAVVAAHNERGLPIGEDCAITAYLKMLRNRINEEKSGSAGQKSATKQHAKACQDAGISPDTIVMDDTSLYHDYSEDKAAIDRPDISVPDIWSSWL